MAFQNGLGAGERIARRIPQEHIVIGIAEGFGSSIPEPGRVHHEGMRLIRIGEMSGGLTERVQSIEQAFRDAGFNVRAFADVTLMIWEKFLCNVTLSAPCAVFDVTVGELMSNPEAWRVALGCTAEAYRLGVAKGVQFPFDDPRQYVTDFAATIPNASPSMRLDHLARRPSEIDVINGQVVELSRALGTRDALQRDALRHRAPPGGTLRLNRSSAVTKPDGSGAISSCGRPGRTGALGGWRCEAGANRERGHGC